MRVAAGLATLTAGAILSFAVSASVPGINLRLTGIILILAAIAGLLVTSPAAMAWVRQRILRRGEAPAPDDDELGELGYLLQDPAVLAAEVLKSGRLGGPGGPGGPRRAGRFGRGSGDGHRNS